PMGLIDAFRAAFAPDVHARLVIKCVNGDFNPRGLALLRERASGYPIDVIDGYQPAQEMDDLVAACDAFVSLHRSGGLGVTMAEAMAAGKPVVATGWSGNTEFMNVANSFPIRYQLVELEQAIGPYQAGSVWAEPSVEHAAEMLKLLFDDRELGVQRGDLARRTLYEDFSAEHVGKLIGTRLQVIADRREAQRSMIEALTHPATEPPVPRAPEVPTMDLQSSIYGWPGRIAKRGVAFFLSYHTLFQRQINQQFASFMRELESVQNRHGERLDEHDRRLDGVTNELQQMRDDFAGALRAETVTRGERAYLPLFGDCESIIVLGVDGCELMQILLDSGASAVCVESDARLVARARARGIPIVNADALAFLASADERVDAIFSTLPLGMLGRTELADFLMNAQNRLRRGGCLVAETEEPDPDILVNLCFQAGFASARIAHSTVRRYALIAAMAPNDLPNHK
ncbi:MAG: glycosyltransferase, partial [Chloroflexi bacterium]|nr:glycosyltransferase [Chloroflexota bacterium]